MTKVGDVDWDADRMRTCSQELPVRQAGDATSKGLSAFIPAAVPFFVGPFSAAPAGKLRAVDDTTFDVFEHPDFAARSSSVNAQSLDYAVIRVNAESGVAHAKSPILSRQFL